METYGFSHFDGTPCEKHSYGISVAHAFPWKKLDVSCLLLYSSSVPIFMAAKRKEPEGEKSNHENCNFKW